MTASAWDEEIPVDPRPEFRCRCVCEPTYVRARRVADGFASPITPVDPFYRRCQSRPTQEDGLCDHCRGDRGACLDCGDDPGCCLHENNTRVLVDLLTPCRAVFAEVPF